MTFEGEPTLVELELDGVGLAIRLVDPTDAQEAYDLLTHGDLENVDPDFVPPNPAAFAEFATHIQSRAFNDETFRRYLWSVRLADGGVLVGLITADIEAAAPEYRTVELTAYFHPDHQGLGYFSSSSRRVLGFAHHRFRLTHQKAMIHCTNTAVAEMTAAAGLTKQPGQSDKGYETWVAELPPLPDSQGV